MQTTQGNDGEGQLLAEGNGKINLTYVTNDPSILKGTTEHDAKKKSTKKWVLIGLFIALAVILIIVLSVTLTKNNDGGSQPLSRPLNPPPPGPRPLTAYYNDYYASSANNTGDTYSGYLLTYSPYSVVRHSEALRRLQLSPEDLTDNHNLGINARFMPEGPNNQFIRNVSYQFSMSDYKVGQMLLTDALNPRYSIPTQAVRKPGANPTMRLEMLGFNLVREPFAFSFTDLADQNNVFVHNNQSTLVFMDKFIQMDFQLPSQRVFGLGERIREFELTEGTWTMWAKGQDSPYDDGTGGHQVYGVHPFVLVQAKKKGEFFGIFFRNSNAQSPLLKYNGDGTSTLSYITTGGQVEVYFFFRGSAKQMIQSYQNVIGTPNLPPFWSLGWQQASWKYVNQSMVEDVVANYNKANIPLEVVWLDIPYLDGYADFTVDNVAFPTINNYVETVLHPNNQKIILILDAGLSADNLNNKYYQLAQQLGVTIQSTINKGGIYNGSLVMKVWPNHTVFLDWFNPNTPTVWNSGLNDLFDLIPYDGLWLDMSEATGFCSGECILPEDSQPLPVNIIQDRLRRILQEAGEQNIEASTGNDTDWFFSYTNQSEESTYFLPFIPGFNYGGNLDNMTLSLNATNPSINQTQYNVHSLYGLMMAQTTHNYLVNSTSGYKNYDNRPFVLSRSTFAGSGQYTSHWLGDNWRDWAYMNYSIAGIMNMNMFGIPQAGADVCGFFGETREDEMCARWIQLATFYPFARAHQNLTWKGNDSERSEPYTLNSQWLPIARDAIYDRYQYLRHMYTCLFEVSQWGGTCFDPLFYYYPEDDNCFQNIEASFIVGGALKVSPILVPNITTSYESYFPRGVWVSMNNFSEIIDTSAGGMNVTLTPGNTVNVHLRDGTMIGYQNNQNQQYNNTVDLINKAPISLIINRDYNGQAQGTLFLDSGNSRQEIQNNSYEYYKFQFSSKSLNRFVAGGTPGSETAVFKEVIILNAFNYSSTDFACFFDEEQNAYPITPVYTASTQTLSFQLIDSFSKSSITFSQLKSLHFGSSSLKDLNLCNTNSFQYYINGGVLPNLNSNTASFVVSHQAAVLPDLRVNLTVLQTGILNIKWDFNEVQIGPNGKPQATFQVPLDIVNPPATDTTDLLTYYVNVTDKPFQIQYVTANGIGLLNITGMLFDQYLNVLQQSLNTTSGDNFQGIFGLGERVGPDFFYKNGVYSMWSKDIPSPVENGKTPGNNIYGTHPFYMFSNTVSQWVGVFLNLASAQDWYVNNEQDSGVVELSMFGIRGIIDLYLFKGATPDLVAYKYHTIVGQPLMIPQWGLGWQQCRYGYFTLADVQASVQGYKDYGIPLDVQWNDIDYMESYRDFTYSEIKYAGLPEFVDQLHADGLRYVPILDAGIARRPWGNYQAYEAGSKYNAFVTIKDGEQLIAQVWPNDAVYPDWFSYKVNEFWALSLRDMHNTIPFDGLWLDMNEASDFCGGLCFQNQQVEHPVKYNLKYIPTGRDLEGQSMPLDGMHANNYSEIDVHSLFGTYEVMYTSIFFNSYEFVRPFIIERSSYAGMGKYGSKWLGDNFSQQNYMGYSVTGIMLMNIFGIPVAGADICGFIGNTTPDLCARWTVLGALYPFSRNHNAVFQDPQEPFVFDNIVYEVTSSGQNLTYTDIMRTAIRNRYHLIRYFYTQIYLLNSQSSVINIAGLGTFYKPLFFEFPEQKDAYNNLEYNIMLGNALKLSIQSNNLTGNYTDFYFPPGYWCNVFVPTEPCLNITTPNGVNLTLQTKVYDFYLHLRAGNIIPMQDATTAYINTTVQLQQLPVDLHVLGQAGPYNNTFWSAQGEYINDDGLTLLASGNTNQYLITAQIDESDGTSIWLYFHSVSVASNFNDTNGCQTMNKNDYLNKVYIYQPPFGTINHSYTVTATFSGSQTPVHYGYAVFNATESRLVFNAEGDLCLPSLDKLTFTKAN